LEGPEGDHEITVAKKNAKYEKVKRNFPGWTQKFSPACASTWICRASKKSFTNSPGLVRCEREFQPLHLHILYGSFLWSFVTIGPKKTIPEEINITPWQILQICTFPIWLKNYMFFIWVIYLLTCKLIPALARMIFVYLILYNLYMF
jgi:hypothetical protein